MNKTVVVLFIMLILGELLALITTGFSSGKTSLAIFAALVFTILALYQYDEICKTAERLSDPDPEEEPWKPVVKKARRTY